MSWVKLNTLAKVLLLLNTTVILFFSRHKSLKAQNPIKEPTLQECCYSVAARLSTSKLCCTSVTATDFSLLE